MSDVLVSYVRALDASPEEYAEHFGKVKEAHPDAKPSDAVFEFYKLSPKSALEREKERQAEKGKLANEARLAIEAGGGEVPEVEEDGGEAIKTPGEKVAEAAPEKKAEVFVESLTKLVGKFDKSYLETIEDEDEKSKLEGQIKEIEDKLKELRKALI
jgi:phage shock protein A